MAKIYLIDIDRYVGDWFSSKRFVKNSLKDESGPVLCRVNSLGGNLDDGIDIAAQFESHGNVTCELFSLNASAATVLTTGAKTVRGHIHSSYLIHKVLTWVNEWGYMNEDDIDKVIEDLQKQKNNSATLTLTIAKMYARKSGKPISDILNLMKEERWLSAEEAKEWGFIDEVFTDSDIKPANLEDPELTRMINLAGLPLPAKKETQVNEVPEEDKPSPGILKAFVDYAKDYFQPKNKITTTVNKEFTYVNSILKVEGVEFQNGKVELTEDQVKNLNDAINTANSDKKTAEDALADKDTEINSLKEQINNLKGAPGADTNDISKKTDDDAGDTDDGKVDMNAARDLFNSLPE